MLSHEPSGSKLGSETAPSLQPDLHSAPNAVNAHAGAVLTSLEDKLEDAADQACAPLIGTLPRADRLKRRDALRQELDTLLAAHRELNPIPERAEAEALAHFARLHPAPVLRAAPASQTAVQTAVQQTVAQSASTRPATLLALGLFLAPYIAIAYGWLDHLQNTYPNISSTSLYRMELFAVPLVAGLLVGLLAQNRAVRGVFNACAAVAALAVLLPSVMAGLAYTSLLPFEDNNALWSLICPNPIAGYAGLVFWPLLGCGSAAAGAKLRHKLQLRRAKKMLYRGENG